MVAISQFKFSNVAIRIAAIVVIVFFPAFMMRWKIETIVEKVPNRISCNKRSREEGSASTAHIIVESVLKKFQ